MTQPASKRLVTEATGAAKFAPKSAAWAASTAVKAGQLLTNGGVLYSVNADMTTPSTFSTIGLTAVASGGGGGAVSSVAGRTGAVTLTADDTPDGSTNKAYTAAEKTKLAGIATGATANTVGTTAGTVAAGDDSRIVAAGGKLTAPTIGTFDAGKVIAVKPDRSGYQLNSPSSAPPLLGATGALVYFDGRVPLQRSSVYQNAGETGGIQSNGTDTTFNAITRHDFNGGHVNEIQVVYTNPTTSSLTITAAAQAPTGGGGAVRPMFFNGQASVTIAPGGWVKSDPVIVWDLVIAGFYSTPDEMPFTKPGVLSGYANILIRTHGVVASGGRWQLGYHNVGLSGEGYEAGVGLADKSLGGSISAPASGASMFGPALVLTSQLLHQPIVAVVGDSIAAGYGDTSGPGFVERAFNSASPPVPMLKMCSGGSKPPYLAINYSYSQNPASGFMVGATHALCQGGINFVLDSAALLDCQKNMWQDWVMLSELGMKVYQTTLSPASTSTDGWTSVGSQTPRAAETLRVQLNAWIRSLPAPLTGFVEVADTLESARDSGKWKANLTSDGLHPNPAGHIAAAAAINTSLFVVA